MREGRLMVKKKMLLKFLIQILVIVLLTVVIFTRVIIPVRIDGQSMAPMLHDGDLAVVNALFLNQDQIERFDVVVLNCKTLQKDIVKRIIGLPGETIVYQDDRLYIDGIYYDESFLNQDYIEEAKVTYQSEQFTNDFEVTLGDDEYFILGDNRIVSLDSRVFGKIHRSEIKGTTNFIMYPFSKIGKVE